jgi:DNA-binding CsgD family transcriptional regulator/PAS domain-containing protein
MVGTTSDSVLRLVDCIYSAAYGNDGWHAVMKDLRTAFGGARACVAYFGSADLRAVSNEKVDDPDFTSHQFLQRYLGDPLAAAERAMGVGRAYSWNEIIDSRALRRRELWNEVYKPMGLHDSISCKLFETAQSAICLHITRTESQASFGTAERRLFDRIAPHLVRAGEMERLIGSRCSLAATFSQMPFGILLLDGHCQLVWMNQAADAIFVRAPSPFTLSQGHVSVISSVSAGQFRRLVESVCGDGASMAAGGTMLLSSHVGAALPIQFAISVAPLPSMSLYGLAVGRGAIVTINAVSPAVTEGLEERLRELFSLTHAEARLAVLIADGHSLKSAATQSGISFGTARNYLIRIFRKTDTSQQTALVAIVKSLALLPLAPLRTP